MIEIMNNELMEIDGGQYPHRSSGQGYSMRSRREKASGRRHMKKSAKELAKAAVAVAAIAAPSNVPAKVRVGIGIAAYLLNS